MKWKTNVLYDIMNVLNLIKMFEEINVMIIYISTNVLCVRIQQKFEYVQEKKLKWEKHLNAK